MGNTIFQIESDYKKIRSTLGKAGWDYTLYGKTYDYEAEKKILSDFFLDDKKLISLEKNLGVIDSEELQAIKKWITKFQCKRVDYDSEIGNLELENELFEQNIKFDVLGEIIDLGKLYSLYYGRDTETPEKNDVAKKLLENHFAEMTKRRIKLHRLKRDVGKKNGINYFELMCEYTGFSSKAILDFVHYIIPESQLDAKAYEDYLRENYDFIDPAGSCKKLHQDVNPFFENVDCFKSLADFSEKIGIAEGFDRIEVFKKEDYPDSGEYFNYGTFEAPEKIHVFIKQTPSRDHFDLLYHEFGHLLQNSLYKGKYWIFSDIMQDDDETVSLILESIHDQPEWMEKYLGSLSKDDVKIIQMSSGSSNIPWFLIDSCLGFKALDLVYNSNSDVVSEYKKLEEKAYSYRKNPGPGYITSLSYGGSGFKGVNYSTGLVMARVILAGIKENEGTIFSKKTGDIIKLFSEQGDRNLKNHILAEILSGFDKVPETPDSFKALLQ